MKNRFIEQKDLKNFLKSLGLKTCLIRVPILGNVYIYTYKYININIYANKWN